MTSTGSSIINSISRSGIVNARFAAIFLAICLLINFLFSFNNYRQGPGITLDNSDFVVMAELSKRLELYSNTVFGKFTNTAQHLSIFVWISKLLFALDVPAHVQYSLAYVTLSVLAAAGIASVVTAFSMPFVLQFLAAVMCVLSAFASYGRYMSLTFWGKAIASTISLGIGFIVLGFFLRGRYKLAVTIAAILIYFHPTHAIIQIFLVAGYLAVRPLFSETRKWDEFFSILPRVAITLPFFILVKVFGPDNSNVDWGKWYSFLRAKTSNPLPLGDGLPTVLIILAVMVLGLIIWTTLRQFHKGINNKEEPELLNRTIWWLSGILGLWLVQLIFSSVLPVHQIIQLALTRATPYAGILVIVGIVFAAWHSFQAWDNRLGSPIAWALLLIAAVSGHLYPLHPAVGIEKYMTEGLAGTWQDMWNSRIIDNYRPFVIMTAAVALILRSHWAAYGYMVALSSILFGVTVFGGYLLFYLSLLALLFNILHVGVHFFFKHLGWQPRINAMVMAVVLATVALGIVGWRNPMINRGWATIGEIHAGTPSQQERKNKEIQELIKRRVPSDAMIVHIPNGDDVSGILVPLRPVFIDRMEPQFVLYDPTLLDMTVRRLGMVGVDYQRDVLERSHCNWLMRGLYVYMCYRGLYYAATKDDNGIWRRNIQAMKHEAPQLGYALVKKEYACREDNVLEQADNYMLIPVDGVAGPDCRRMNQ